MCSPIQPHSETKREKLSAAGVLKPRNELVFLHIQFPRLKVSMGFFSEWVFGRVSETRSVVNTSVRDCHVFLFNIMKYVSELKKDSQRVAK